jgi:hypothetical protein
MINNFNPGVKVKLEVMAGGNSEPNKREHHAKSSGGNHAKG